ncbi:MAG: DUF1553 domain-containing protein [Pirellulales bacterium]|nr:DUF1553 domain-containing protein [Pirellulales bacterium]
MRAGWSDRCFAGGGAWLLASVLVWVPAGFPVRAADDTAVDIATEAPPTPEQIKFFERHVRPVLAAKCFSCHGPNQQKGGLRLDSRAALLAGGDSGPAIVVGEPAESLLVDAVNHGDLVQMPPQGKLPERDRLSLARWVRMGAPWPPGAPQQAAPAPEDAEHADAQPGPREWTDEDRAHWAFQPIARPAPPAVQDVAWCRSPIDHFILAKLEAAGLKPAPPAEKRTLVRRITFDLTGLPPTPAEIDAFSADDSPDAVARLVDRLLATPQYGERWGRHWLDVARYADSNGMDENLAFGEAHRYRDYVVAAFNRDLAYDQFIREQLAGDLLPPEPGADSASETDRRNERLVATGFLCIGPKMLAEDDPVKMEMDIIDEQVDTLGQAFLGLTLGCARCHDHKFDPLSQGDYYALAGIFKSTQTMENFSVVARWQERPLVTPEVEQQLAAHERQVAELNERVAQRVTRANDELIAAARARAADYLAAAAALVAQQSARADVGIAPDEGRTPGAIVLEAEAYARGNLVKDFELYGAGIGVVYNRGELPNFIEFDVEITDAQAGAYQLDLRYAAASSRPIEVLLDGVPVLLSTAERVTGSWTPETQSWQPAARLLLDAGKHTLRFERDGPFPHVDKVVLAPRDWPERASRGGRRTLQAAGAEQGLVPHFLAHSVKWLLSRSSNQQLIGVEEVLADAAGPFVARTGLEGSYVAEATAELVKLREELTTLEKSAPVAPRGMAVSERSPQNLCIHIRGSHLNLGAEMPRGFPSVLDRALPDTPAIAPGHSGRLELADWIAQADHPLTARVIVNRVWLWHFGEGLVRTPDNFGCLGEAPTHPELLDWLAGWFVEHGWSIKALHRLMMTSSTYQMSAAYDADAASRDADNRLWWRFNRRRLEAEELRDAILATSGRLDPTPGGSLLVTKNREYVAGTASVNPTSYASHHRSIYLPVVRSALYDVFQAFDFPDPSVLMGRRDRTTVAPQALFMLNSSLVLEESRAWAERLLAGQSGAGQSGNAARINDLYRTALGRSASEGEIERAEAFLVASERQWREHEVDEAEARLRAWAGLCRTVWGSNEFVFVD